MDWITEHWDAIAEGLGALLLLATIIIGLTPTKRDDRVLWRLLDWLSMVKPGGLALPFKRSEARDAKPRDRQRPPPGAIVLLLAVVAFPSSGCDAVRRADAADALDKTLNVTTATVDPIYDLAVSSCRLAELVAIERGAEADATRQKVLSIRSTCDGLFASFDSLRELQATLRTVVDDLRRGEVDLAIVVSKIAPVSALVRDIQRAVAAFRREHDLPDAPVAEPDRPPNAKLAQLADRLGLDAPDLTLPPLELSLLVDASGAR